MCDGIVYKLGYVEEVLTNEEFKWVVCRVHLPADVHVANPSAPSSLPQLLGTTETFCLMPDMFAPCKVVW